MPTSSDYIQKWLHDMFNHDYDPYKELERIAREWSVKADDKKQAVTVKNSVSPFEVRSVLSNRKKNAFTVVWADGTSTVVHCQPGDDWDDEKALAMCFTKKALGNKGNFNDKFNDALDNKMKIIPRGAGIVTENECDCDGTCEECKCEKEREKVTKMAKMVKELGDRPLYNVYLHSPVNGENQLLVSDIDIAYIRHFLRTFIHDNDYGPYYRVWNSGEGAYIDYGSYSQYLYIPGLTASDLACK